MATRSVKRLARTRPAHEGAGVHLHRAFGFGATSESDPFLQLDDFDPQGQERGAARRGPILTNTQDELQL